MIRSMLAGATVLALSACSPSQQAAVNALVEKGALFCAKAQGVQGALVMMLANAAGVPVSVINQTSTDVAAACALVGAIPVSPPANPSTVPVVSSTTTLPPTS